MVSTHVKNISQNGSFPQIGMKIKNLWNHHPVKYIETSYTTVTSALYQLQTQCKQQPSLPYRNVLQTFQNNTWNLQKWYWQISPQNMSSQFPNKNEETSWLVPNPHLVATLCWSFSRINMVIENALLLITISSSPNNRGHYITNPTDKNMILRETPEIYHTFLHFLFFDIPPQMGSH